MGRPKKIKPKVVKEVVEESTEVISETEAEQDANEETVVQEEEAAPVEVLTNKAWLYHNDHEPRIFEAGPIPAGWHRNQKPLDFFWSCDGYGKWSRKEK